jgi:predicted O-methyltransferase YrrM
MADLISDSLQAYLDSYSDEEPEYLRAIRSQTEQEVHSPHMLSGHYQGRLLAMISKLISPVNILEIGTYTGYSALCLAEGLPDHGKLITIEKDATLEQRILKNFSLDPIGQKIQLLTGDAHQILQTLDFQPDLVFVDADKRGYESYFDFLIGRLKSGAVILADNVLWSGKVLQPDSDKKAAALHAFNKAISADQRVEKIILPIRDGLTLIRKK